MADFLVVTEVIHLNNCAEQVPEVFPLQKISEFGSSSLSLEWWTCAEKRTS